jgi:hypothetical protein
VRFRFRLGMDDVLLLMATANILMLIVVYLVVSGRVNLNVTAEEMHERIDVLEEALKVVGGVLERLPELVPQLTLQTSPFQALIEAFAERMKENMGARSYADAALRDPEGRFTDGEREKENEPTA